MKICLDIRLTWDEGDHVKEIQGDHYFWFMANLKAESLQSTYKYNDVSIIKLTVDGKEDELLQEMYDAMKAADEARYQKAELMMLERENNGEAL
jgi:hypothetical protein